MPAVYGVTTLRPYLGVSAPALHSDRGLASRLASRGPIWSRCRVRAGLEMTSAASGNGYSTPSTRPMAAAESRTAAASPRLSRAKAQLPRHLPREALIRADTADGAHEFLTWQPPGQTWSVGMIHSSPMAVWRGRLTM